MPTLILLPGMDGTGLLFDDFIAALDSQVSSEVIDYPRDEQLTYAELQALVHERLPRDRPFALLAESFSGPIAIALAAAAPPGLAGLILCCSFARNPRPELSFLRAALHLPLPRVPSAALSPWLLGRYGSQDIRVRLRRALAQVSNAVLRARALAALSVDVSRDVARIRVPILYLRGKYDRLIPESCARLIAALAQDARIVDLKAPHFLLQTVPTEAAIRVEAFLRSLTDQPEQ